MFSTFVVWDNNNLTPAGVIFKLSLCEATVVGTYEKLPTIMLGEIDNKGWQSFCTIAKGTEGHFGDSRDVAKWS